MPTLLVEPEQRTSRRIAAEPASASIWPLVIAFLERTLIVFCIYALSIGPMYWQWLSGRQARGTILITAFYEPLRLLGEIVPLFGEWLNSYIRWWIL